MPGRSRHIHRLLIVIALSLFVVTLWPSTLNQAKAQAKTGGANQATRYYPETGHNLTGAFLNYYDTHGGLPIFGYPLTEPFTENGRTVQYFEQIFPNVPCHRLMNL